MDELRKTRYWEFRRACELGQQILAILFSYVGCVFSFFGLVCFNGNVTDELIDLLLFLTFLITLT